MTANWDKTMLKPDDSAPNSSYYFQTPNYMACIRALYKWTQTC